jgi:Flp pilus assembly protein TadD
VAKVERLPGSGLDASVAIKPTLVETPTILTLAAATCYFSSGKGCKQMNRKQRRAAKHLSETAGPARRQFVEEGLRHHQAGRLDQAKNLYLYELTLDPANADAMHFLGLVHCQQGDLSKAEELISKALAIKPSMAEAHSNLGVVLKELKRCKEALVSYDRALALRQSGPRLPAATQRNMRS